MGALIILTGMLTRVMLAATTATPNGQVGTESEKAQSRLPLEEMSSGVIE